MTIIFDNVYWFYKQNIYKYYIYIIRLISYDIALTRATCTTMAKTNVT